MDENVTLADQLQKGGKDDRRSDLDKQVNVKPHNVHGLLEARATGLVAALQTVLHLE